MLDGKIVINTVKYRGSLDTAVSVDDAFSESEHVHKRHAYAERGLEQRWVSSDSVDWAFSGGNAE